MNKTLRSFLVAAAVMAVGSPAPAHSDASLTIYPDVGIQRGASRIRRDVQVVFPAPAFSTEKNAAKQAQLEAKLEALGIAVD